MARDNVENFERDGLIDSSDNLKGAPVYIFSGGQDYVVKPIQQEMQRDLFESYGANVKYNYNPDGAHWPEQTVGADVLGHILPGMGVEFKN